MDGQIEGRKLVLGFLHHSKSVTSSEDPQLRDQLLKRTHAINLHIWYVLNGQNWGNLSSSSRSPDSTLVMDGQVKEPLRLSQFYFRIIQKSIISLVHLVSESNICRFLLHSQSQTTAGAGGVWKLGEFKLRQLLAASPAWKWFIQSWKAISWEIEDGRVIIFIKYLNLVHHCLD